MAGHRSSAELTRSSSQGELGATAVEYTIMVVLVTMAIVVTVGLIGESLVALFSDPTLLNALTP